ncbi:MAG: NERD domain-containing protein [Alkalicoccus sp.]|nr:MAG: NERD domain-containing protein [Alkalicoccus sp.]
MTNEVEKPLYLEQYEALLRRLPERHSKYARAAADYQKYAAGFQGEENLTYTLAMLNLHKEAFIRRSLRLKSVSSDYYFQIDLLIVTPYFLYVGEVKNYSGKLLFEPHYGQLTQIKEEMTATFPCPIQQGKRQARQLTSWLEQHGIKRLPVHSHVLLANPRTRISAENQIADLYHAALLPEVLDSLRLNHTKRVLTKEQISAMEKLFAKENAEGAYSLLERYNLKPQEILQSITCPSCSSRFLKRRRGGWDCTACGSSNQLLHVEALRDLALLYTGFHPLSVYRIFLGHISVNTTRKLLDPYVISKGNRRSREYKVVLEKF